MAITNFKIEELPNPDMVVSEINNIPLQENVLYPIYDQENLNFKRTPAFENYTVVDSFKWKVVDENGNESNLANGFLKWRILDDGPSSDNLVLKILNSDIVNLFNSLSFNNATEIFQVKEFRGPGFLKKNNNLVYEGETLKIQDLFYVNYYPERSGGGDPYFEMDFYIGQNEIIDKSKYYTLTIDIDSFAKIETESPVVDNYDDVFDVSGTNNTYNVIEQLYRVLISDSHVNSIVNVQIEINSPYLALNEFNEIEIEANSENLIKKENETFNVQLKTDNLGFGYLTFLNYIVEDASGAKTGNITVTLIDVNGDTNLVSSTNQIILNTDF